MHIERVFLRKTKEKEKEVTKELFHAVTVFLFFF